MMKQSQTRTDTTHLLLRPKHIHSQQTHQPFIRWILSGLRGQPPTCYEYLLLNFYRIFSSKPMRSPSEPGQFGDIGHFPTPVLPP